MLHAAETSGSCSCAQGRQGRLCKHRVAVLRKMGLSAFTIFEQFGVRAGSAAGIGGGIVTATPPASQPAAGMPPAAAEAPAVAEAQSTVGTAASGRGGTAISEQAGFEQQLQLLQRELTPELPNSKAYSTARRLLEQACNAVKAAVAGDALLSSLGSDGQAKEWRAPAQAELAAGAAAGAAGAAAGSPPPETPLHAVPSAGKRASLPRQSWRH